MSKEWGWFRNSKGRWEKRKYDPREETPEEGPPDQDELWNGRGGAGSARLLNEYERDALFIQTGQDFDTLRDAEKYGEDHGFRIGEGDDNKRIEDTTSYDKKVTKDSAAMNLKFARRVLTSDPAYARNAREGGSHAEQARREGRD